MIFNRIVFFSSALSTQILLEGHGIVWPVVVSWTCWQLAGVRCCSWNTRGKNCCVSDNSSTWSSWERLSTEPSSWPLSSWHWSSNNDPLHSQLHPTKVSSTWHQQRFPDWLVPFTLITELRYILTVVIFISYFYTVGINSWLHEWLHAYSEWPYINIVYVRLNIICTALLTYYLYEYWYVAVYWMFIKKTLSSQHCRL